MRIKTNIPALNASGILRQNQSKLGKNLEKLSSGYRINRAGDDAAGLAISEKMRALITGMKQADLNARDGVGLIRTGEGALQEVHAMINRLEELAVQSANGIYNDEMNRASMQEEANQICKEIERIARTTTFNGTNLFQDVGLEAENSAASVALDSERASLAKQGNSPTLADVLADKSDKLKNIIYTEITYDFVTDQNPVGADTKLSIATQQYQDIANALQTSIVPQVVNAITEKYTAFKYLVGSSIGIGLELYSNSTSTVLASVALRPSGYKDTSSGNIMINKLTYSLSVNVASVGDLNTLDKRSSLEQTIAHEMIHAFMDEATTVGMTGIVPSGQNKAYEFPSWFVEGMAQTASGPGNWTRGGLVLTEMSTQAEITAALRRSKNLLGSGNTASLYGTGYLACMYLSYLASGKTANMDDPTAAAQVLVKGASQMLSDLIAGNSLTDVINAVTNNRYQTIADFQNGFASDTDALGFIQKLLKYTSSRTDVNVGGGLLSGSLSETNPVPDDPVSNLKLFALNTTNTEVQNEYPSGVTVLSGGGSTKTGVGPTGTPPAGVTPPTPVTPPAPVTYPADLFTVAGGNKGTDWEFDSTTGTLRILTGAQLTISGGTKTDATGNYYGNIVVADGVHANLTLNNIQIDASKRTGNAAGIQIGNGCNVTLTINGTNSISGGGEAAGVQLTGNSASSVTINMESGSVLTATGGTVAGSRGGAGIGAAWSKDTSQGNITIKGEGTLNANGGYGAAGIGGSQDGKIGDIVISGTNKLNITSKGGEHGAGIGGGWVSGDVNSISIDGAVEIDASSIDHGTGIGGGCRSKVLGAITIGKSGANNDAIKIVAKGGNDGAAIGAGWQGEMGSIIIHGGNITATSGTRGAGIGSGYQATGGTIEINGGTINATGSTNSSGIGSGMDGTVSGITIAGGTISADGGWTYDGGNIGGYTDKTGNTKAAVTIKNPSGLTIKAGEKGEGKYITTGAVDADGKQLYALDLKYIGELLAKGKITPTVQGTDGTSLSFPMASVKITRSSDRAVYSWNNLQHMGENSAYIWARGEDITLEFEDGDGTVGTVDLKFFNDYGLWRMDDADLPPELPREPGYVGRGTPTSAPELPRATGGIILQVGPNAGDTFGIPRFYFSRAALKLDEYDISTQNNARDSIEKAGKMIDRVSEIRGTYGALDNALEHIVNNLGVNIENLSESESRIRDTDMAKEMMEYTKNTLLVQSAQAMLAQANTLPQAVLQLLQ